MDAAEQEFLRLCEDAIVQANHMINESQAGALPEWASEAASRYLAMLQACRQRTIEGKLRRPSGGVRLGLTGGISDNGIPELGEPGRRFYDACWRLENWYATKM